MVNVHGIINNSELEKMILQFHCEENTMWNYGDDCLLVIHYSDRDTVAWIRSYKEESFLDAINNGEFGDDPVFSKNTEGTGPAGSYSVFRAKWGAVVPIAKNVKKADWKIEE